MGFINFRTVTVKKVTNLSRRIVLLTLCLMIGLTVAMPNQVMALGLFDQKPQPKQTSILPAQKVDITGDQAVAEASPGGTSTGGTLESGQKKTDRTIDHEITSKRTAYSSTYVNKDGTKTLQYSKKQVNYKKNGQWEKIDNQIKDIKKPSPKPDLFQILTNTQPAAPEPDAFTGSAGLLDTTLKSLDQGVDVNIEGKVITIKPVGANNVKPKRKDNVTVVYENAWPGVDLEYTTQGELLKENIIIKNQHASTDLEFSVEGGKVIDDVKNPGFYTIQGMQDGFRFGGLTLALNDRGPIDVHQYLSQSKTSSNGIKVSVDKDWFGNLPKSSFPITVDPSFGRWDQDPTDWMFKSDGYGCTGATCWIQAGTLYDNGWKHWRSYVQFPYPELAGKTVLGANIHAYYNPNANPDPNQRYLFMGHANCIGWECRGKYLATVLTAGDFDVNVTGELQAAVNGGDMGTVWSFWGEEVPYKTFKTYYNMSLSVNYDTPTPIATPVEPADKQVTVNTQPTLRVNPVGDADGDAVQYYFRVSTSPNAESGVVINSGWIPTSQWTVPEGILQDGTTYYWHVYTLGATQTNPNWVRSLKIDLRNGKDSTQSYSTVGPVGIDLANGNATTGVGTHTMSALGGSIGLNMNYDSPVKTKKGLTGEYWNVAANYPFSTTAPTGNPSLVRNDQDINFTWLSGSSPNPGNINSDWFYARWKGYFVAPVAGSYSFGASQDDAVNINVNGQNFSGCMGTTPCYYGAPITLQAGQVVPITASYEEATGDGYFRMYVKGPVAEQIVPRDWLQTEVVASTSQYGLAGRYYVDDGTHNFPMDSNDPNRFMMARNDSSLSFDWGLGGPAPGLQTDNFMVKWTGYVTVPTTGTYTFGSQSDDGVRVKLNNGLLGTQQTVLDSWQYVAAAVWGSTVNLTAGQQVPITIEYFEAGGPGRMSLLVRGPGVADQNIPTKWLTPKASALPDAWRLGVNVDGNVGYERLRVAGTSVILEDSTRATHEYTWTGLPGAMVGGYKPPVNEDGQLTRNGDNTYTLVDTDGRTYVFDAEGKLKSLTSPTDDKNPSSLKYEYSGDPSRLMKITDGVTGARYGTLIYKNVNEDGSCSVPGGFDVVPDGMLCAFKTSDGSTTKLYYRAGQLSRIEKPGNDLTDYGYDSFGRIISVRDNLASDAIAAVVRPDDNNVLTEVSYDQLGRVSAVKAPAPTTGANRTNYTFEYLPGATQFHVTGAPEPNGFSKRVEYDNLLRTTKVTDAANLGAVQEWDSVKDLQLSSTDATGLKSTMIYDDDDRAIENYGPAPSAWYGSDRKPLLANINSVPKTTTGYDEGLSGPAVSWFNVKGSSLTGSPKLLTQGIDQTQKTWFGRDFRTNGINFTPDAGMDGYGLSATGKVRFPATGTYTLKLWHDDGARLSIDDQSVISDWDYRSEGIAQNTNTGTFNAVAGKVYRFKFDYLHTGNPGAFELWWAGPGITDTNSGLGTSKPSFVSPDYSLKTSQTAYDSQLGNVTSTTSYAKPEYGQATTTTVDPSGLNLQASATFEAPGSGFMRQTGRTLPGGTSNSYNYYGANDSIDNPCTVESDPALQAGATKGKTETDPDGNGPLQPRTTEAIYNASGKVVATRFNNDPWTCITYDNRGRQTNSVQPTVNGRPGRTISTQYAADNNPLKTRTIDSVAGTTESVIDILGRTVSTKDVWGNDYSLTYDNYGNITQKTGPLGTETYTYDSLLRLAGYALNATALAAVTYDNFGRVATVTYPEAKDTANNTLKLTQVKRDNIGRSAGVVYQTSDGKTFDETVVRSQLGKITSATQVYDSQTLNSNFVYDAAGRLTSGTVGRTKFDYGYNAPDTTTCSANSANNTQSHKNSNRTSYKVTNTVTNTVVTNDNMCYNYADQLTYSTDASIGTPVYDDHGNTTSFSGNGTPLTFGYDANDYNTSVTQGTKRTEYVKAATGDVLRKKEFDSGQLTSSYRYVAGGAVLQTCSFTDDSSCATVDRYVTLPGNVSLTLSPTNPDSSMRVVYSLRNYHGDTALTLTTEGKTTASTNTLLAYGPFGEQLLAGTQGTTTINTINASDSSMGWAASPARKQDSRYTTSFIQMGARVYIPSLGRFLQIDPVDGGTLNGYVYVADPINSSDYNGQWGIGDLFASIVKVVRAVVKAVVTPVAKIVNAVVRTVSSFVNPPRVATSSSVGGGRTGGSVITASAKVSRPGMLGGPTGEDIFDLKSTKPGNTFKSGPSFDALKAASTASDYYAGGALAGGWAGCIGGAIFGGVAGIETGIIPGATLGCYAGGHGGTKVGGAVGAATGFLIGGFDLPGQDFFAWGPDQVYNPFKY